MTIASFAFKKLGRIDFVVHRKVVEFLRTFWPSQDEATFIEPAIDKCRFSTFCLNSLAPGLECALALLSCASLLPAAVARSRPRRFATHARLMRTTEKFSTRAAASPVTAHRQRRSPVHHRVQAPQHLSRFHALRPDHAGAQRHVEGHHRPRRPIARLLHHHAGLRRPAFIRRHR